jgi:hypothetical protein
MDQDFFQKLEWIHNVKCPVCGTKASFVIIGHSYRTDCCGHPQIEKIIHERELECFPPSH